MRHSILLAVVVALFSHATGRAQEDLFSEVAMESVFETSSVSETEVASKSTVTTANRITGATSLVEVLKEAGMEPKVENGRVSFALAHNGWSFPVTISVHVDHDHMACEMSLTKIRGDAAVTTPILLRLLAVRDDEGAAFAYDPDKKLIQLRASLPNRSITAARLTEELSHLATLAETHSEVWMKLKGPAKKNSPETKPVPTSRVQNPPTQSKPAQSQPVPTSSPQPPLTLLGRWSASLASGEAFAIELTTDSKFKLVHLKSGKSTITQGSTTRSGSRLALVGDGLTLNCEVTQTTADAFQLGIQDSKGNVAVKLDFKKAK